MTTNHSVSIIIPCLNESKNIERCLDAIAIQTYPHKLLEILIADGMSTDNTRKIINHWSESHDIDVRIVNNPKVIAEFGNASALKVAQGNFIYLMGADEVMAQPDFIEACVEAFELFPDIVGVEQYFLKIPGGNILNNYLSVIHINDPLARDIAIKPVLQKKTVFRGRIYNKYSFKPGYPSKLFFKRSSLKQFESDDTFEEGQVMLSLANSGKNHFARIDNYGVYHYNIASFRQYMKRCTRIALKHTTRISERKTWVSYTGKRIYLFALLHLTVIYPFVYSCCMSIKKKEPLWLLHAPIAFICTFLYVINFIIIKITRKRAW